MYVCERVENRIWRSKVSKGLDRCKWCVGIRGDIYCGRKILERIRRNLKKILFELKSRKAFTSLMYNTVIFLYFLYSRLLCRDLPDSQCFGTITWPPPLWFVMLHYCWEHVQGTGCQHPSHAASNDLTCLWMHWKIEPCSIACWSANKMPAGEGIVLALVQCWWL